MVAEVVVVAGQAEHGVDAVGVAPMMSLCIAMRLRSRVTICRMGFSPICFKRMPAARLDMRTMAV